jgi:hypothetical protein
MNQSHLVEYSPEYLREKRKEYAAVARGMKSGQGSAAGDEEQFDEQKHGHNDKNTARLLCTFFVFFTC